MLPAELTRVHFPTGSPTRQRHVFFDFQLGRQAKQLHLARNAVIQQNFGAPAAGEIANLDIERRTPAIDGCDGVTQAHTLRERSGVYRTALTANRDRVRPYLIEAR